MSNILPTHRNSKSRAYPLRCQDSGPATRSYTAAAADVFVRCCCCCDVGARTHTRTVPLTSGWRVYIPRQGTHQAGCAASRPRHLPSHSDRAQTLRSATSYVPLQRGFTATPARCWAALYGVGCLSVRAAKRSLYVSRARHLSACLFHVSASGAIKVDATANSRRLSQKTLQNLCFIGRGWPNFPSFCNTF